MSLHQQVGTFLVDIGTGTQFTLQSIADGVLDFQGGKHRVVEPLGSSHRIGIVTGPATGPTSRREPTAVAAASPGGGLPGPGAGAPRTITAGGLFGSCRDRQSSLRSQVRLPHDPPNLGIDDVGIRGREFPQRLEDPARRANRQQGAIQNLPGSLKVHTPCNRIDFLCTDGRELACCELFNAASDDGEVSIHTLSRRLRGRKLGIWGGDAGRVGLQRIS